ncbi:sensor histidine kinase [Amycolatopsis vastitatis]|uniref:histidine kinase n=1 Tax=Amycolatopsis vastitatis TaxID=1905142 RepID=A0A229SKN6_9PSEU|nr:HAMP domain-containing sensor histidine kinase [Amycolatopsis vastitatis]OXM59502.1 two-component sensor histidine kinase [Amycolatopsis vastitatis]
MRFTPTVRWRLTAVYSGLFLLSGAGLLLITYLLVAGGFPVVKLRAGPADVIEVCTLSGETTATGTDFDACAAQAQRLIAAQQDETLRLLLFRSGAALAIMTVVSVGLGWFFAGRALRPLRVITAAARHISASDLHQRLAMTGRRDELRELGDTFDGLLARLDDAFTAQRQFVANASHELRTPLARQRTVLEVALADPDATVAGLRTVCGRVLAAGEQQERLIEALLTLARSERGLDRRDPVDLRAVTASVVSSHKEIRTYLSPAPILGDARLAERMVANLVDNAVRHNIPDGTVEVTTESEAGTTTLTVTNTGPVIPPGEVDRLLQPFTRLTGERTARDGLGLGLPIVAAIVTAHGGDLDVRPGRSGGLVVTVRLPASHGVRSQVARRQRYSSGL